MMVAEAGLHDRFSNGYDGRDWDYDDPGALLFVTNTRIPRSLRKYFDGSARVPHA